jgi:hypothetical protein
MEDERMDVFIVLTDDSYQPEDAEGMRRKIAALVAESVRESDAGDHWTAGLLAQEATEWEAKLKALESTPATDPATVGEP